MIERDECVIKITESDRCACMRVKLTLPTVLLDYLYDLWLYVSLRQIEFYCRFPGLVDKWNLLFA